MSDCIELDWSKSKELILYWIEHILVLEGILNTDMGTIGNHSNP